jgi:EpsI family protein
VEHLTLGNVIFVVLLLAIFFLAHRMGSRPARSGSGLMPGETRAAFAPSSRYPWRIVAPLLLLGVVMVLGLVRAVASASPSALGPLPVAVGAWLGPYPPSPLWHPLFVSPDREVRAAYTSGAGPIEIYVNAYGEQKQGAELVSWGNTFLAPGGWKEAWPPRSKPIAGQLNSFEARGPLGGLWLIAYTFQVGGTMTHSEMTAQLTYGVKSILHPVPAGVVALAARCDLNCEAARVLVESFWGDMSGSLLAMIPAQRSVVAIR